MSYKNSSLPAIFLCKSNENPTQCIMYYVIGVYTILAIIILFVIYYFNTSNTKLMWSSISILGILLTAFFTYTDTIKYYHNLINLNLINNPNKIN